jgi:hypothetical protein
MSVVTQIQVRRGTAAQWTSTNPTLASGEWGYETDTGKVKIGDGTTAWNSEPYIGAGTVTSITAGTGLSGGAITTSGTIAIDTATTVDVSTAQTLTNKTLTGVIYTQTLLTPSFTTNVYTLALGDQGDILLASNGATAGTINVPTDASVNFPVGTQITIIQTGAGQLTIQATTSGTTTIRSAGATSTAPKLRVQNSSATLIKASTDNWYVVGDIQ